MAYHETSSAAVSLMSEEEHELERVNHRPTLPMESFQKQVTVAEVLARTPVTGLLGLALSIVCAIGTVIVLALSDGVTLEYWRDRYSSVQPTVLLAILSAFINACVRFSYGEACAVAWWVAGSRGSTVDTLQRYWQHGSSVLSATTAQGGGYTSVGLSGLLVALIFIDGPLFQRASTVRVITQSTSFPLTLPMSSDPFESGETAGLADHASEPTFYMDIFSDALKDYNSRREILISKTTCQGTCEGDIVAAGFDVSCNATEIPWSYPQLNTTQASTGFNSFQVFNVTVQRVQAPGFLLGGLGYMSHQLVFTTISQRDLSNLNGGLLKHQCVLTDALIKYPVRVVNNTLTLLTSPDGDNSTASLIWRGYEAAYLGGGSSSIGGFWLALRDHYESSAFVRYQAGEWWPFPTGTAAREYLNQTSQTWSDPMPDMLSMMRELAFRTNLVRARDLSARPTLADPKTSNVRWFNVAGWNESIPRLEQQLLAQDTYSVTIYESHFEYLAAALAVIVFCLLGILPLFWGWWILNAPPSLSPIEIGRAFEGPILVRACADLPAEKLTKKNGGNMRVKYDNISRAFVETDYSSPHRANAMDPHEYKPAADNDHVSKQGVPITERPLRTASNRASSSTNFHSGV